MLLQTAVAKNNFENKQSQVSAWKGVETYWEIYCVWQRTVVNSVRVHYLYEYFCCTCVFLYGKAFVTDPPL